MQFIVRHVRIVCFLGLEILVLGLCSFLPPVLLGAGAPGLPDAAFAAGSHRDSSAQARVLDGYGKLPLSFEANQGQTDERVKFLARGSGYTLFLTGNEAVFTLRKAVDLTENPRDNKRGFAAERTTRHSSRYLASVLRMGLVGANPAAQISGLDELPGRSNYFVGNDPKKWRTDVPNYAKVRYQNVHPGVDLVYYGNQRQLEYDFVVAPGADPRAIRLRVAADLVPSGKGHAKARLLLDANGDLLVRLNGGDILLRKPVIYQPRYGSQSPAPDKTFLDGKYRLNGKGDQISFEIAHFDRTRPLVIDPVLAYSSFIGGSDGANGTGIAVDGSGNAYLTGFTGSPDFPRVGQIADACKGSCGSLGTEVAFVTKINAAGSALVYSSFVGGSGGTYGAGIAVDSLGNAYLLGTTASADFPQVNQIPGACLGTCGTGATNDVYVTAINAAGNALVYSDLIGGSGADEGYGIAADPLGNAYITGITDSTDFPRVNQIPGACQGTCGSANQDAFVVKIDAGGGGLVYSSYLGGSAEDEGISITADGSGNAYLTGFTHSTDFPRVNQIPGACLHSCDNGDSYPAFVTKINTGGTALVYSSYLGGGGTNDGFGIAVDGSGNVYVTGRGGLGFPQVNQIPGACQGTCGGIDVYVTKIDAAGDALVYSSLVGGSLDDIGYSIAVDGSGNAYLTGTTDSYDFPQVNQISGACLGTCGTGANFDGFVTKIDAAGDALVYSNYFGGSNTDTGYGIAVDGLGNAYLIGITKSTDFPIVNQIPGACPGRCNPSIMQVAFATKISSSASVNLSPASLNFGPQGVDGPNTPQVVTLTNIGGGNLLITDIAITGQNSSDFDQTNDCPLNPNPLTPNGFCKITVYFFPDETGMLNAAVTITDNAPNSPQMVSLTGIGIGGKVRPK